jgi:hypothetical protein
MWSGLLNLHKLSFDLPFASKSKERDTSKLEYLVSLDQNILNLDSEPTFVSCSRKEVISFTIETSETGLYQRNEKVSGLKVKYK